MQEDQKYECKFCNKTFPTGRSLGGHMRSHLINHQKPDPEKKTKRNPKKSEQHSSFLDQDFHCKECSKAFQSCKALFGHMKSHSQESSNISSDHQKKRSNRAKRHNIDHQDQQEVALSLIMLSMDSKNSIIESSSDAKQTSVIKIETESRGPFVQRKRLKRVSVSDDDFFESEVNSPKISINKNNEFGSKFACVICKKAFHSYQALGGHRASHKKFKGCCAPTTENTLQSENSLLLKEKIDMGIERKENKDHECPICFKVFQSGQALGGHKRSHIVADQSKSVESKKRAPQIRDFLDLNLPAPVEDEFKPWWIATSLLL